MRKWREENMYVRTLETLNIKKLAGQGSYGNELYTCYFLIRIQISWNNELKKKKKNHMLTYRKSQENYIVIP